VGGEEAWRNMVLRGNGCGISVSYDFPTHRVEGLSSLRVPFLSLVNRYHLLFSLVPLSSWSRFFTPVQ